MLQITEADIDPTELQNKVSTTPFSYDSPAFWRILFIPQNAHVPCPVPEVRDKFPYQYGCIGILHHALGDGIDSAIILPALWQILNNVIAGRPVSDEEIGELTDKRDIHLLKQRVKENLKKNPNRADFVRSTMPHPKKTPLILKIFPKPGPTERTTKEIFHTVEPLLLQQVLSNVKMAGVTFNSCLMSAINVAIVELAHEAGEHQTEYEVSANILTQFRPYIKNTRKHQIGPFSTQLSYCSRLDKNTRRNFWQYCKKLHHEFITNLKSGMNLEQAAVREMDNPHRPVDDYFTNPQPVTHDYGLSNLGIMAVGARYENIQVTQVYPYNIIHSFIHSNIHQVLMIQDQCYYNINYDTHYFSDQSANTYIDRVLSVLEDAAKLPVVKSSL